MHLYVQMHVYEYFLLRIPVTHTPPLYPYNVQLPEHRGKVTAKTKMKVVM